MIVSSIAGTTRDSVDVALDIDGYPIIITDTAGFRKTENIIEKQGIKIAKEKIKQSDIIIALYDVTEKDFDKNILPIKNKKIIYAANKIDKISLKEQKEIAKKEHLLISAKYGQGIKYLEKEIINFIKSELATPSNVLITRERYKEALKDCVKNLKIFSFDKDIECSAEDIRLACRAIGKITGEVKVDEILDNIFGSFCIGK